MIVLLVTCRACSGASLSFSYEQKQICKYRSANGEQTKLAATADSDAELMVIIALRFFICLRL